MQPVVITYKVHEVVPYINWIYFFHAWDFGPKYATVAKVYENNAERATWITSFGEQGRVKATEALNLFREANRLLARLDGLIEMKTIYRLCRANADGNNLLLEDTLLPLLRQQEVHSKRKPYLCLSDFVYPLSAEKTDTVGVFAATVSNDATEFCVNDPYKRLLVQTLCDRLAEAATEKLHQYIRREAWGYAKDEELDIPDLLAGKFKGIRPAVGYPCLPDQSINFILDKLLDMQQIGITLTENGAMSPHASVSGLMLGHPATHYFAVGKIGEDQLEDYAKRRQMDTAQMRKFLAANL